MKFKIGNFNAEKMNQTITRHLGPLSISTDCFNYNTTLEQVSKAIAEEMKITEGEIEIEINFNYRKVKQ